MASLFGFDFELALRCLGGLFGTETLIERKAGELEILPLEGDHFDSRIDAHE